jgi:predicted kinase
MEKKGKAKNEKPLWITVSGLSGSGKSTLAKALAGALPNAVYIDSDRTRKQMFGYPVTKRLPPKAYTLKATLKLVDEMNRRIERHLDAGKTVVQSILVPTPQLRKKQEGYAVKLGVRFQGIWLKTNARTLFDRVAKRRHDASDARVELVEQQVKHPVGRMTWPVIDAGQKPQAVLKQALRIVADGKKRRGGPKRG